MQARTIQLTVAFAIAAAPGAALAQDYDWEDDDRAGDYGITLTAGGGVAGFTDPDMRDVASEGGMWEARVAVGTRRYLSLEAAYIGSAQAIDALGLDTDAMLVGTGFEGALRANFLTGDIQPYVLAGMGWTRYSITNADVNTSDLADADTLLTIPVGAGLSYRIDQVVLDARAVYRTASQEDLLPEANGSDDEKMHSWNALLQAGYEF
jgi:opacity protein-like surface antigen